MRRNSSVLLLIALAMGIAMLGSSVSGAASVVLLGDQTVLPAGDSNSAGSAEAFKATATTTGTVATLSVYVDTGSTATTLIAGLYADAAGKPGALLGSGGLSGPGLERLEHDRDDQRRSGHVRNRLLDRRAGAERPAEVPRPLLWRRLDDLRQHADDAEHAARDVVRHQVVHRRPALRLRELGRVADARRQSDVALVHGGRGRAGPGVEDVGDREQRLRHAQLDCRRERDVVRDQLGPRLRLPAYRGERTRSG